MKTIQTKSGEILLVKVPEDVTWWEIFENVMGEFLTKTFDNQMFLQFGRHTTIMGQSVPNVLCGVFNLPKGVWSMIGKFSELEDGVFEEFVESVRLNVKYYKDYSTFSHFGFRLAKESFISLCKSQGIEDDLNQYLIIKKL
jgi:hypothetical protein